MSLIESYLNITVRVAKAQAEAALASLRGQLTGLQASMAGAGTLNADSSVASVNRLTGSLRSAGYALSATFTAPILLAGKSLLSFQLANETAMADLKKVYGNNPLGNYSADIKALGENFKALSSEFGVNQTEVIKIGAAWAQAGVQGSALSASVQNTLKAMIIGDINSTEATTALISIQGQYRTSAQGLTQILNALNVVENTTAISMEGLITGFQRAAGAAANGGVTYKELAALLASITPYAGTAAQAGNSLKTIISNLEAPSHAAAQAIGLLGINIADSGWKSATATDKLKQVAQAFEGLSDAQKNVIARQLSGAFQVSRFDVLLNDIALSLNKATAAHSRYGQALAATTNDATNAKIANYELQTVLDSNPKKLQIIGDTIKNKLGDVLAALMPLILNIADAILKLVTWFTNLSPSVQKLVGYLLVFLAILGPVLLYVSAMRDLFRYTGDAIGFLLKPLKLLPEAFALLASPITGVMKLFGLFGAAAELTELDVAKMSLDVGTSMRTMMAEMVTILREMLLTTEAIWAAMVDTTVTAGARQATAAAATSAAVAEEVAAGAAAVEEETVAMFSAVLVEYGLGGEAILGFWTALFASVWDLYAAFTAGTLQITGAQMAAINAEVETGLVLYDAEWAAHQLRMLAATEAGMAEQVVVTRVGMKAIEGAVAVGAAETETVAAVGFSGIPAMIGKILAFIPGLIAGAFMRIFAVFATLPEGIVAAMSGAGEAIMAVLTSPVTLILGGVVLLIALFRKQLEQAWNGIVNWFKSNASSIGSAFTPLVNFFERMSDDIVGAFNRLPQGVQNAFLAVVNIVEQAAKAVYSFFSWINPWAHHSPSLVENVTSGMDAIQAQFGRLEDVSGPIMSAYAQLQKFAALANSMSGKALQVTIAKDSADILKAGGSQADVNAYKADQAVVVELTAKQNALTVAIRAQQTVVDGLDKKLRAANLTLTQQNAILTQLQATQQAASDGMTQAQADLQKWQSYGITGQQAMSDAIFASQQHEKDLQLQMMKIEDVTGPMQNVQSRMQALQGSMDALRGTAKSLREQGAGQEITGVYDAQVAAMQKQFDDTKNQVSQYDQLNQQLTDAQRKTQELQLQDSLTYDPLTRQIQEAATAMKELPFDQILKGVQDSKALLDQYTDQYNKATAAVKAQELIVKNLTAARDALQAKYDAENQKLQDLQKAYSDLGTAISDVNAQIQQFVSSSSTISNGSKGGALSNLQKNFAAAAGGNFPTALGKGGLNSGTSGDIAKIQQQTDQAMQNLQNTLGKINPFGGISKWWDKFKTWWDGTVMPFFHNIGSKALTAGAAAGGLALMFTPLGPIGAAIIGILTVIGVKSGAFKAIFEGIRTGIEAVGKFLTPVWHGLVNLFNLFKPDLLRIWDALKDAFIKIGNVIGPTLIPLLKDLRDLWNALYPTLKVIAEIVGFVLIGAFKVLVDIFSHTLGPALDFVIHIISNMIQVFRGLIQFVTAIFTGDWKKAWSAIVNIVSGVFKAIWNVIKAFGLTIWDTVKGIIDGIVGFFKWLYDVLVGHSIIPDLVNAIVDLFNWMIAPIKLAWNLLWTAVKAIWDSVVVPLFDVMVGVIKAFGAVFGWIWDNLIKPQWDIIWAGVAAIWKHVAKPIFDFIVLEIKIWAAIFSWIYNNIIKPAWSVIWGGLKTIWNEVGKPIFDTIKAVVNGIGTVFGSVKDAITTAWSTIWSGLKQAWESVGKAVFQTVATVIVGAVNIAIEAINALARGFNAITGLLHIDFKIGTIDHLQVPKFATGGILPTSEVGGGFITNKARAIVGEGGPDPEYVIPTDPKYRNRAKQLWFQLGKDIQMLEVGGTINRGPDKPVSHFPPGNISEGTVNREILDAMKSNGQVLANSKSLMDQLGDDVVGAIKTIGGLAVEAALKAAFWPVKTAGDALLDTIGIPFIQQAGHTLLNDVWNKIDAIARGKDNSMQIDSDPVKRFAPIAARMVMGLHFQGDQNSGNTKRALMDAASNVPDILNRLKKESGGDPNAINNWDSNAAAGHPSRGLMQVIDSTFNAYAGRWASAGIFDPNANIFAGLNYAQHRYGSIRVGMDQPGGYANGGIFNKATFGLIGEAGAELLLPLTNPARAWELIQQSGLLNIIGTYMNTRTPSIPVTSSGHVSRASATVPASGSSGGTPPVMTVTDDHSVHVTVESLVLPNVKTSADAQDLLDSLEALANGSR